MEDLAKRWEDGPVSRSLIGDTLRGMIDPVVSYKGIVLLPCPSIRSSFWNLNHTAAGSLISVRCMNPPSYEPSLLIYPYLLHSSPFSQQPPHDVPAALLASTPIPIQQLPPDVAHELADPNVHLKLPSGVLNLR